MERNPRPAATVLYQVIHVPPARGRKLLRTCTGMDSCRAGRGTCAAGDGCVRRYRTDGGSVLSGNPRAACLRQEAAAHMHRDGFLPRGTHDVRGRERLHALCARVLDGLAAAFSQVIHVPPARGRKLLRTCTGMDSSRAGRRLSGCSTFAPAAASDSI